MAEVKCEPKTDCKFKFILKFDIFLTSNIHIRVFIIIFINSKDLNDSFVYCLIPSNSPTGRF